jgi:hypothetical protein
MTLRVSGNQLDRDREPKSIMITTSVEGLNLFEGLSLKVNSARPRMRRLMLEQRFFKTRPPGEILNR